MLIARLSSRGNESAAELGSEIFREKLWIAKGIAMQTEVVTLHGDWAPGNLEVQHPTFTGVTLLNLEGPVLQDQALALKAPKKAGPVLQNRSLPISNSLLCFSLANNHIMDLGPEGLTTTIQTLDSINAIYAGAGPTSQAASKPARFRIGNRLVSLISVSEIQFGQAGKSTPGFFPLDSRVHNLIRREKGVADFVIVAVHSGSEMFPWPSPQRQFLFRSLVDTGADIIWGHHSHVPQGWEKYLHGFIFYGLGNFAVRPSDWSWHPNGLWSLSPRFQIEGKKLSLQLTTHVIEDGGNSIRVRESSKKELRSHLTYLSRVSQPLYDEGLLTALHQHGSSRLYAEYFESWLGFSGGEFAIETKTAIQKLLTVLKVLVREKLLVATPRHRPHLWYHLFACESHREVISTAIGLQAGVVENLMKSYNCESFLADLRIRPDYDAHG